MDFSFVINKIRNIINIFWPSMVIKDSNYIINLSQFGPFLHGLSIISYVIEPQ